MWYTKSIEAVLKEFNVEQLKGLTDVEASVRLKKVGRNVLIGKKKKNIIQLFLAQLNDWLIYILLAAVVVTLFMGEYVDAMIITLVVFINAILGVIQEFKAGQAVAAIQKMTVAKALVRRGGEVVEIDSELVVPGDVLMLDAGRYICADIRLLETVNLQVQESVITGESVPSVKDASTVIPHDKTPLGDRANMAFMSTMVVGGRGFGVAVETGMTTEVGKIANIISNEVKTKTPLEIRLGQLGKTIGLFAIGICVVIFIISMLQGRNVAEVFLLSVSLAVAAIPEGLAAIVAVVLSIGVTKMSKKHVIIKKLPAVETLGSVNIICSDKTGTLTQNKMTVTSYFTLEGEIAVERGKNNAATDDALLLAKALFLCSDATYNKGVGTGDPTEIALLLFADDVGINRKKMIAANKRADELAFDSDRKLMSSLNHNDDKFVVYTKGAIHNLLAISTHVLENGKVIPITSSHRKRFEKATDSMSNNALRTLGVAFKNSDKAVDASDMEKDLIFVGIVGMIDPPRPQVKSSIETAKVAGITTIMITGDHKNTAFAIALELGIAEQMEQVMTGLEIDDLSDRKLKSVIEKYRVFARVSPQNKVQIVHALKSHGNIVSMTGDGVNDAPSLNAADIGVAMGITGTDVAKSASDMILTNDNFATIVYAIEQGRNIYNNIKKSVVFLLTCNLGEVIAVFISILLGWSAPLLAIQLLWINLITDSLPAIALGMDPGNHDVMKEKPRPSTENFFARGAGLNIILGGMVIGAITMLAFWIGHDHFNASPFDKVIPSLTAEVAGTMAFMVLVLSQLFYSLALRNRLKSIFQTGIFSNKYLVGAILLGVFLQLIIICIPSLRSAFHLQLLSLQLWMIVVGLSLLPLVLSEIIKLVARLKPKAIQVKRSGKKR